MSIDHEFNERQYRQLCCSIDDFESARLSLANMSSRIEGLIGALEGVTEKHRNELIREWSNLEITVALCSDERRYELTNAEADGIKKSLVALRDLCRSNMTGSSD